MGLINRPVKVSGANVVSTGEVIYASDWEDDITTIYDEFNGNIEDANIKSAANIDPSKIGDASAADANANTVTSPGTTASPSKATTLVGELERLRYNDLYDGAGVAAIYNNGTSNAAIGPWDGSRHGHNLIYNGGLQVASGGSGVAAEGWTIAGTPSALTYGNATPAAEGDAECVKATGGGTADGLYTTIEGIKADTLYVIGVRARAGVNAASMTVTGAVSTGAHKNTSVAISVASTFTTYSMVVKSDSSGSDITVQIATGTTSLDEVYFYDAFMYEIGKNPVSYGNGALVTKTLGTETTISPGGSGAWVSAAAAGLDVTITPWKNNQRVVYTANFSIWDTFAATGSGLRITENGTRVAGPFVVNVSTSAHTDIAVSFVRDNPVPGTDLVYAVQVWDATGSGNNYQFAVIDSNVVDGEQTYCDVHCRLEDI